MNDDEMLKKMKKDTIPRTAPRGMNIVLGALYPKDETAEPLKISKVI